MASSFSARSAGAEPQTTTVTGNLSANRILLASHGTDGARAAERTAVKICMSGAQLHHLIVVPTLWQGMTGDDWLNNGATRDIFRRYLESELGREVDEHCDRISKMAKDRGLDYHHEIVLGEPKECLLQTCMHEQFDLVIIGSPRPRGKTGLRSRIHVDALIRKLSIPLLVVPYPDE